MADKKISQLPASTTPLSGTEEVAIVQSGVTKKTSVESVLTSIQASGTANGVAFLNGSKVLTTGSSLTFNGNTVTATNTSTFTPLATFVQTASAGGVSHIKVQSNTAQIDLMSGGSGFAANYMGADEAGLVTQAADGMRFNIGGSYARWTFLSAERMRLTSAGDVTVSTGNLVIGTAGKGIDFSGVGTAAEILDDYEEGTFTPTITAESGTITSFTASGTYTKIGNTVRATFTATITDNGTGASVLNATLPFATANVGEMSVGSGRNNATGNMLQVWAFQGSSTAKIYLYDNSYPVATGSVIYCTVVYQTT